MPPTTTSHHEASTSGGCVRGTSSSSAPSATATAAPPSPCLLASARAFWALWRATEGKDGACGVSAASTAATAAAAAASTSGRAPPSATTPAAAVVAASAAEAPPANANNAAAKNAALLEERYGTPTSHTSLARAEVERLVDDALANSEPVRYLLDSLARGGCGVGRAFFHVARCDGDVHGGFSTEFGVVLCHNRIQHAREVELALAHELVHAYDFCRARDLDLRDCRHHACTEVRAAALSGDCSFSQELLRGNLSESLVGQYKRCVRRRAAMSVAMNPHCSGPGEAEAAVAAVLPQCFRDTDPWPRIPALG